MPLCRKVGWPWEISAELAREPDRDLPRITIVTPSWNQGEYLEETIRSVLGQRYPNLEYIVVDGDSTDATPTVLSHYRPFIEHVIQEKDGGQSDALNKGFRLATGRIFGFLNSDDVLVPGALLRIAAAFGEFRHRDAIISFSGVVWNGERDLEIVRPRAHHRLIQWRDQQESLFQPSTYWTSHLHTKLKGFREELRFCFDKEFFVRAVFDKGSYRARPESIVSKFRLHPASKTSTIPQIRDEENLALAAAIETVPKFRRRLARERRSERAIHFINSALESTSSLDRLRLLLAAVKVDPFQASSRFYLGAWRRSLLRMLRLQAD